MEGRVQTGAGCATAAIDIMIHLKLVLVFRLAVRWGKSAVDDFDNLISVSSDLVSNTVAKMNPLIRTTVAGTVNHSTYPDFRLTTVSTEFRNYTW